MKVDLLIKNAAQLVTPMHSSQLKKEPMSELLIIEDGSVAIYDKKIVAIGTTSEISARLAGETPQTIVDAAHKVVLPGFVDCHTHPIFLGTRENEFEMRIRGKNYREIADAGGGIRSSVRNIRGASKEQIIEAVLPRLDRFIEYGTTTIEAKSGYGLSLEDEIKSLEVIRELNKLHPIDLVPTFLGAHEIPDEYRANRRTYIELIINEMIPRVAEQQLAEFCDIFIEQNVFTVEEGRQILNVAKKSGLRPKVHANQLTANNGAALSAEVGAISAEHLDHITPEEIEQLANAGVIAVLLPGAVFFLNLQEYAPARKMIESGLLVAISTDFNPGSCMTESMPIIMSLACIKMRLLPSETIMAATLNAAMAIDRQNFIGSLEVGKKADIVIWDMPNYLHLPYHFGVNLVHTVIKDGIVVWEKSSQSLN